MVSGQTKTVSIKGKITDGELPLQGVKIIYSTNMEGTQSDENGAYRLSVPEGEVLRYSHVGFEPVEIIVEDLDRTLNIIMVPKVNQLDAVTVTKTRPRKTQKELFQEYNTNPNLIKTMFGILDKEASGTSLYVKDEEEFSAGATDIIQIVNQYFPGAKGYKPYPDPATWYITMRNTNSLNFNNPTIYEIDGLLTEDFPFWLDVNNIKRMASLPSFAALTKYGSIANGGLLIINTKTSNFSPGSNGIAQYDQAKIRDNIYDNSALQTPIDEDSMRINVYNSELTAINLAGENPSYLNRLLESKSETEAKVIYENQRKMYGSSPYFVLDAYDYFSSRWKDKEFADSLIESHRAILKNNAQSLKALAYIFQAEGRFKKANEIYKEIFVLRPNYAQSYMDLANSYIEIGEYEKATTIYGRYGYLIEKGFLNSEGDLGTLMSREFNNLITLKGNDFFSKQDLKKLVWNDDFDGTRLVFEWNDSEAEFKLQFVNPGGNYYISEHSLFANPDRIREEKKLGYSSEEYLVYDFLRGLWRVNLTYLGNKSLTPTYLKATLYYNYGSVSQRKETKVFKTSLRNVKQQLFTVSNVSGFVTN